MRSIQGNILFCSNNATVRCLIGARGLIEAIWYVQLSKVQELLTIMSMRECTNIHINFAYIYSFTYYTVMVFQCLINESLVNTINQSIIIIIIIIIIITIILIVTIIMVAWNFSTIVI